MSKKKVLFICVHNSARSQMAEAFLNQICREEFEAHSAGLEPGKLAVIEPQPSSEIMQLAHRGLRLLSYADREVSQGLDDHPFDDLEGEQHRRGEESYPICSFDQSPRFGYLAAIGIEDPHQRFVHRHAIGAYERSDRTNRPIRPRAAKVPITTGWSVPRVPQARAALQ